MTQWRWGLGVFVLGLVIGGAVQAASMDPLEVAPHLYSKKFENEQIRVMEVAFKPGESIDMHSHPDHVAYLLTGGTLTLSYPDGTSKVLEGKAGDLFWTPAESHAAVNTGTTDVRVLVFELKP